jgi:hypothetical protein
MEEMNDEQASPCFWCGRKDAHTCAGDAVCDACCILTTEIAEAVPEAEAWMKRFADYHVRGKATPTPVFDPSKWERGPFAEVVARRRKRIP